VVLCICVAVDGVEEIKDAVDVFFDTQFATRPGREWNVLFKVLYLEPIFNVES
jgi:hypothetical protein